MRGPPPDGRRQRNRVIPSRRPVAAISWQLTGQPVPQIGMGRELATQLVYQTVLGSTAYAKESGLHPAVLRDMVTSPGGTTAEGLRALERQGTRAGIMEAIIAAYRRTRQLGQA